MRITTVVSTASLVLFGTIALAQSVTYDFDKMAKFSRFRTYAWVSGTTLADELNHRRVVDAISGQLANKGLARVEQSQMPDLLIAYHASFDRDLRIVGFSSGWGPYRFGPGGTGEVRTDEILTGTLEVDVVDAATNGVVWWGRASKEIDVKADPRTRERNINRAVERLLKNFPPTK